MSVRLKASSLGMAIIIALLMALLCGFFVMRAHLGNMTTLHYALKDRLERNCNSGLNYLLSGQTEIGPDEMLTTDLFDQGLDSVSMYRKTWGAYEVVGTVAFNHGISKARWAIAGSGPVSPSGRTGLYVNDLDRAISICGHSALHGKTYIPDEGIKRAYIEGQNYVGDKLIYGEEVHSQRHLPPIDNDLVQSLSARIHGRFPESDSLIAFSEISDSIANPFSNPTCVYTSQGVMLTGDLHISGNAILWSPTRILVQSASQLEGIILCAPDIEIESGFRGSIQAFASHTITTGDQVELLYPSVLGLLSEINAERMRPQLILGKNFSMKGSLLAVPVNTEQNNDPVLTTADGFTMEGELYVDGSLDLKGSVFGSVWCHKLVLKTNSGVYENHLLNVIVDPARLSAHFLGSAFFTTKKRSVLQWLS